jgi:HSP20 family protein
MPSLARVDPLRDLWTFRSAMDRLFDETAGQPGNALGAIGAPAIDLFQIADDVVIKPSLPGVNAKDLNISVIGDVLPQRGDVQEERETEGAQNHVKERRSGSFTRSIALPAAVVADQADAQIENSILTLKLPNAEEVETQGHHGQGQVCRSTHARAPRPATSIGRCVSLLVEQLTLD